MLHLITAYPPETAYIALYPCIITKCSIRGVFFPFMENRLSNLLGLSNLLRNNNQILDWWGGNPQN